MSPLPSSSPCRATHLRPVHLRHLLATAAALALAATALVTTSGPAQASAPSVPAGWTRVFLDDFTGAAGTGVSSARWQYTVGTSYPGGPAAFGTNEIETMTSSTTNVVQDGAGRLLITPRRSTSGAWTSGRIETVRSDFQPPAGGTLRVDARIALPNVTGAAARGYWPAFWMLGAPFRGNYWNWPAVGELDVMENVHGLNTTWATVHCGVNPGGPCNETTGLGGSVTCPGVSCQAGFHVFAVEWDRSVTPERIRFSVDGLVYNTVTSNRVDAATWQAATGHGFFVILNVAMGGAMPEAFGGGVTASTVPGAPMIVDYVQVLQRGATTPAPTPTPTGTASTGTRDAYATIQAESYDGQSGTALETTSDSGGGQDVTSLSNGDWLRFRGVDFGTAPATQFLGRVASGAAAGISGLVEVRLDAVTSPPVATFAVADTGGWQSWRTVPMNMTPVTGRHDVYVTFTSGQPAAFVNLNWVTFGR